jgi:hypothetical protein
MEDIPSWKGRRGHLAATSEAQKDARGHFGRKVEAFLAGRLSLCSSASPLVRSTDVGSPH